MQRARLAPIWRRVKSGIAASRVWRRNDSEREMQQCSVFFGQNCVQKSGANGKLSGIRTRSNRSPFLARQTLKYILHSSVVRTLADRT